jgi:hypothetical protein
LTASIGLAQVVKEMLRDTDLDFNAKDGTYGSALQAASALGNVEIVQMLVDAPISMRKVEYTARSPMVVKSKQ